MYDMKSLIGSLPKGWEVTGIDDLPDLLQPLRPAQPQKPNSQPKPRKKQPGASSMSLPSGLKTRGLSGVQPPTIHVDEQNRPAPAHTQPLGFKEFQKALSLFKDVKGKGTDSDGKKTVVKAKDEKKAVEELLKSDALNYDPATCKLGDLHKNGLGDIIIKDCAEAMRLYMKAAKRGFLDAAFHVGCAYLDGTIKLLPEQNPPSTANGDTKSGDQKLAAGTDVIKDKLDEAIMWFEKAKRSAKYGKDALFQLGNCYKQKGDIERARDYFQQARSVNHPEAAAKLKALQDVAASPKTAATSLGALKQNGAASPSVGRRRARADSASANGTFGSSSAAVTAMLSTHGGAANMVAGKDNKSSDDPAIKRGHVLFAAAIKHRIAFNYGLAISNLEEALQCYAQGATVSSQILDDRVILQAKCHLELGEIYLILVAAGSKQGANAARHVGLAHNLSRGLTQFLEVDIKQRLSSSREKLSFEVGIDVDRSSMHYTQAQTMLGASVTEGAASAPLSTLSAAATAAGDSVKPSFEL